MYILIYIYLYVQFFITLATEVKYVAADYKFFFFKQNVICNSDCLIYLQLRFFSVPGIALEYS